MPRPLVGALISALVVAASLSPRASATDDTLTPQERRGRDLYVGSPDGAIAARIGGARAEAPAAALACAACHGADGRGSREGEVVASNITWDRLTAAYGATQAGRRRHPAYTEASFSRAVGAGIDPAGHALHSAMPRFELPLDDVAALVSYLKRLGTDQASGVTDSVIRDRHAGPVRRPGRRGRSSGRGRAVSLLRSPQRRRRGVWPARRAVRGVARGRHARRRANRRGVHSRHVTPRAGRRHRRRRPGRDRNRGRRGAERALHRAPHRRRHTLGDRPDDVLPAVRRRAAGARAHRLRGGTVRHGRHDGRHRAFAGAGPG